MAILTPNPYRVTGTFPYKHDSEIDNSFFIKINNKWWKAEDPNDLVWRYSRKLFDYDPYREKEEANFDLVIYFLVGAIKRVVIKDMFKSDSVDYTYEKARDYNIALVEKYFEEQDENEEFSLFL